MMELYNGNIRYPWGVGRGESMSKEIRNKDLVIIGGGPAGLTAAIYATRAKLDMILLEDQIVGGQVRNSYY